MGRQRSGENSRRRRRIILIGRTMCGKTTLCQRITERAIAYCKTQTLNIVDDFIVDTPGEYLERMSYRGALAVASADVDVIVLVQDPMIDGSDFPPLYSSLFAGKPVVGIVTKIDLADAKAVERAKRYLSLAGAEEIFAVSAVSGEGLDDFIQAVCPKEGDVDEDRKTNSCYC
ncbi:EutP/PduV family microcompartment system protein [Synergistes jonesii]|uniref:Ethanolamine utilization protein EutP n=1 Tax=Synergistes jonesii TaxID=2754 RepID=A0A073ISH7_9BACT|nr:EutP/PduV family microcompartment system protein [Synergistes jonesii]KEJ92754.1 hypothetical protein EH55_00830 [Synergistes jonesii]MDY2984586.1 EutP/PduV family microcompartment system protein [Synergistes jonesii]